VKIYADLPARRSRQLFADLLFLLWLLGCVWMGCAVGHGVAELGAVGQQTASSATSMAGDLAEAGSSLRGVPLVGAEVATPFDQMSSASRDLAAAGRRQVTVVHRVAWAAGISAAVVPILLVAVLYLPRRWRFAKEATAGARLLRTAQGPDLFALRALTRQPMSRLAEISADPAAAWRAGDWQVVTALAQLELQDHGLAMPTPPSGVRGTTPALQRG
jgi:hypothetical protein